MKRPVPTQTESKFGFDEFFFSTTNKRGVVASGNDVFVRVSAYPRETILGAPHSLIRHPDMPRAVFKVLWDTIQANKSIGAYVKNLASNGSYYWVFAFIFPIENGYLSIRFKPSSAIFQAVQDIYQEVLEFEAGNEDLDQSVALLARKIQEKGFSSYEEFMVQAALTELQARDEQAQGQESESSEQQNIGFAERQRLEKITEISKAALARLNDTFRRIQGFQKSRLVIVETIDHLSKGFNHLKYISINMTISAAKFGTVASSLGVVSKEFSELSGKIESHFNGLTNFSLKLAEVIQQCAFRISALHVQMLMVDFFVKESVSKLKHDNHAFAQMSENQKDFSKLFEDYSQELGKEIDSLRVYLNQILNEFSEVRKFITGLEVIKQIGAVESARVDEVKVTFVNYLDEMNKFIQLLRKSTAAICDEVDMIGTQIDTIVDSNATLSEGVDRIFGLAEEFEIAAQADRSL